MKKTPIFIHGLWRSSSTYIWNKFRVLDETLSFYEPLNELISILPPEELLIHSSDSWHSNHHSLNRPYFYEFDSFYMKHGFIPFFHSDFVYKNYFICDNPLYDQKQYIQLLIDEAYEQGRTPVLQFCRSMGRMPWFQNHFEGIHILLVRNAAQQWASGRMLHLNQQNSYFDLQPFYVLGMALENEWAIELGRRAKIPNLSKTSDFKYYLSLFKRLYEKVSDRQSYAAFASLYLLSLLSSYKMADLIIDVDKLSLSSSYQTEVRTKIRELIGISLDFSDANSPTHNLSHFSVPFEEINQELFDFFEEKGDTVPLWIQRKMNLNANQSELFFQK